MDLKEAATKYKIQQGNAKKRGIEWEFTFESWTAWWDSTGKWDQRGRGSKNYVMGRNNDKGPYSPSNVKCITNSENFKEFHTAEFDVNRRVILQEANKLKNLKVHTCPHCGKQSRGIGYFGFHGEKCKFKPV